MRRALLLVLLLLCGLRCEGPSLAVVVRVSPLPDAARSLRAEVLLTSGDGAPRLAAPLERFALPMPAAGDATFGLRLPADLSGTLTVAVAAFDGQGCLLTTALGTGAPTEGATLTVALVPPAAATPPSCPDRTPLLRALTPAAVIAGAGLSLKLTGFGFHPGARVTVAGVQAQVRFVSPLELAVVVDLPLSTLGGVAVVVTNPDGKSDTLTKALTVEMPQPVLRRAGQRIQLYPPNQIILADTNRDRRLDMIVASGRSGTTQDEVLVLRNLGTEFQSTEHLNMVFPLSVAAGDLDLDQSPDLVAINSTTIKAWRGSPEGRFTEISMLGVTAPMNGALSYVTLGDFNTDGRLDIVATMPAQSNLASFVGQAGAMGPFIAGGQSPTSTQVRWAGLVAGQKGAQSDVVFLGPDRIGLWTSAFTLPGAAAKASTAPAHGALVDLNADGTPDLVFADPTYAGTGGIGVSLSVRAGGQLAFRDAAMLATGNQPRWVATGDLNGDGRPDVLTVGELDGVVLLNRGGGVLAPAAERVLERQCATAAIGDLNNDGKPDVAIGCGSATGTLQVYTAG